MSNESCSQEGLASIITVNRDISDNEAISDSPESEGSSDAFGDGDCGEPLVAQHIVLDFTPNEEDTDYVQRKCCAFWEFVNSQPELQNLLDTPESEDEDDVYDSKDNISIRVQSESSSDFRPKDKTAVSMLELVEEKGLIGRAFESRLPTSHCSVEFMDYEGDKLPMDKFKGEHVEHSKHRRQHDNRLPALTSPRVRDMCKKLEEWDLEHPKSMEPPGPAPGIQNAPVQQKAVAKKECTCVNYTRL